MIERLERLERIGRSDGRPAPPRDVPRVAVPAPGGAPGTSAEDLASMGVAVLDAAGRVAYANQEATRLLARSGVLFRDSVGCVRCRDHAADQRLRRMLEAVRSGEASPEEPSTLTLARADRLPVVVQVAAEPVTLADAEGASGILVLLRDADREPLCAPALLQAVFGLTSAEAGVVARLAAGLDPATIAGERGVSTVTVRNQVKSALGKVGVGRQAELVSIALRVARL